MKDGVKGFGLKLFVVSLLYCSLSIPVFGQSTAQITGAVRDQSGAVLPGVEVTATQTATGVARNTITNETGSFTLPNLPIGPYRLEAILPGFRTFVQTGIALQVSDDLSINVVLEVGQMTETVEVQADAALVETRSTGVGQVIDNARVLELPLNGRQVTELILLTGAAVVGGANGSSNENNNYPTTPISVAGGLGNGLAYMLDGGVHNQAYGNLNMPMPFPDALQEFKVETSALQAQYGYHSAGAVNAVTKSGTNEFQGSLFEFLRNGALNARDPFALTRDELKRNQFGGTFGGPIVRNKLFFFAGHQTTTERSLPTDRRAFIPTAAMVAGDFSTVTSTACRTTPLTLRPPFANNRINPALYSPAALNYVKILPTTTDPCGEVRFGRLAVSDEYLTVGRVDYQITERHGLFGRYMQARRHRPSSYDGESILSLEGGTNSGEVHQYAYSFVLGSTNLIGANLVSSFRATVNREYNQRVVPKGLKTTLADLGIKNVYDTHPGLLKVDITNGFNIASSGVTTGNYNATPYQLSEDLSFVRGPHQFGFGANYIHHNFNAKSNRTAVPQFSFDGGITGLGLGDFLLGRVSTFQQSQEAPGYGRQHYIGTYFQDAWRVNSRLTMTAGLRWEPFLPGAEKYGRFAIFDKAKFDQGVKSTQYPKAPAGLVFPGDPEKSDSKYSNSHWLHFSPRLGFAWDPSGDGRMTIRAAGGIFFDLPHLWVFYPMSSSAPFGNLITLSNVTYDDPWADFAGGNPFPMIASKDSTFPERGTYLTVPPDSKTTYAYQWNLSIQRQISRDMVVSANYIGNQLRHQWSNFEGNPIIYIPGASTTANYEARRQLVLQNPAEGRYYGLINKVDDGGTSSYNGLLLSIQRRTSAGLSVQGNYTWAHCIADPSSFQPGIDTRGYYPGRRREERSECSGARRQVFNVSTVYETPQFANPAIRALLSDWRVSGIVRLQTGGYFTVTSGIDTSLTNANGRDRAHQVLADAYAPNKSIDLWLNPAAFAQPATGEWGNAATNLQGPGTIRIDGGLTREFQLTERQSIQFRAEAFNVPNHVNPGNPATNRRAATFGRIQSGGEPRIIQLALKYVF